MRWASLRGLLPEFLRREDPPPVDEREGIGSRDLTPLERDWVQEIVRGNERWKAADLSQTVVTAEGWCGENQVSRCLKMEAPAPQNPAEIKGGGVLGELWIETDEGCVVNVQLSHSRSELTALFILFVDPKHPRRRLPQQIVETRREVVAWDV